MSIRLPQSRGALIGASFAIGALSVAGLPPAAGFVGKLELFRAAAGDPLLIAFLFVGGALSFVYAFQAYQFDFWRGRRTATQSGWPQQVRSFQVPRECPQLARTRLLLAGAPHPR